MNDLVILVNEQDEQIGTMLKLEAHEKGFLHRAFSIFLFNKDGEMLIQQRSFDKYHSAGLWSNSCCSHPFVNEDVLDAAHRRLGEEMGLKTELEKIHSFIYHEALENGLFEHEFDHVFVGITEETPQINLSEVVAWEFKSIDQLKLDMENFPSNYTIWFRISLQTILEKLESSNYLKNIAL